VSTAAVGSTSGRPNRAQPSAVSSPTQTQYLTKHPSASCFCGLSSVSKRLYPTVSTRELRTDRRRAVAVGGGQPPTRQRRHSPAGLLGRWLAVESVVRWPIRGDGPTHREGRPRSSSNHIDELLVRPPPEATPASAGRRHIPRSEGTARRSVRGDSPPRTAAVPLIRVVVVAIACSNKR